jgi:hypothetical protein
VGSLARALDEAWQCRAGTRVRNGVWVCPELGQQVVSRFTAVRV